MAARPARRLAVRSGSACGRGSLRADRAGFDKDHDLALVVGCAAALDDAYPVGERGENRLEGIVVPELDRVHRLHIVMAMEQGRWVLRAAIMRHHHRATWRVAHRGVESDRGEVLRMPLCAGAAILRIGRVGGDGSDAQQREESLQRRFQVGVYVREDVIEPGHGSTSMGRVVRGTGRPSPEQDGWPRGCFPALRLLQPSWRGLARQATIRAAGAQQAAVTTPCAASLSCRGRY